MSKTNYQLVVRNNNPRVIGGNLYNWSALYVDQLPMGIAQFFRQHNLPLDGSGSEFMMWDQDKDDLRQLSRENPDFLFELTCTSEYYYTYRMYFYNGKMQRVAPVFPPFDSAQLE